MTPARHFQVVVEETIAPNDAVASTAIHRYGFRTDGPEQRGHEHRHEDPSRPSSVSRLRLMPRRTSVARPDRSGIHEDGGSSTDPGTAQGQRRQTRGRRPEGDVADDVDAEVLVEPVCNIRPLPSPIGHDIGSSAARSLTTRGHRIVGAQPPVRRPTLSAKRMSAPAPIRLRAHHPPDRPRLDRRWRQRSTPACAAARPQSACQRRRPRRVRASRRARRCDGPARASPPVSSTSRSRPPDWRCTSRPRGGRRWPAS